MFIPTSSFINSGTFAPPPRLFKPPRLLERWEYVRPNIRLSQRLPCSIVENDKKYLNFDLNVTNYSKLWSNNCHLNFNIKQFTWARAVAILLDRSTAHEAREIAATAHWWLTHFLVWNQCKQDWKGFQSYAAGICSWRLSFIGNLAVQLSTGANIKASCLFITIYCSSVCDLLIKSLAKICRL